MDDNRRCTARSKQSGERCKRAAVVGASVCSMHGGKAPRVRYAAQQRVAAAAAVRAVATFGLPRTVDPHVALLEEIARTAGHVDWLGEVVAGLEREKVTFGVTQHVVGRGPDGPINQVTQSAQINVWVELYQKERTHLVAVCKAAISAGVEERQVALAEEQGAMVVAVLRAVFADAELGLTVEQHRAAQIVAARHLRAVDVA
jgi:hypothetical protein